MEAHIWISIVVIITYLYYLTKVFDGYKKLYMQKIRIHLPKSERKIDQEKWLAKNRSMQHELLKFKKKSYLWFFSIPLLEIVVHFSIGGYVVNRQILSAIFLFLFLFCLFLILHFYKGRKSMKIEKKYASKSKTIL